MINGCMEGLLLVENSPPYSLQQAKEQDKSMLLRYRNRICKICGNVFDIEVKGIFYRCGCDGKN